MTAASTVATALAFCRHALPVLFVCWPVASNGRLVCCCPKGRDCRTPAKHPFGKLAPKGLLSATTDVGIIKGWGDQAPDANLGLLSDSLIVLDSDPRHGGDDALRELEREHEFPPTWRVLTGGGGEHVYFRCPAGVTVRSSEASTNPVLGAGVDVRARVGYVITPPSRHISGRSYAWSVDHHPRDVALAEAPPWLIERLAVRAGGNGVSPETWRQLTSGTIREYPDRAAVQVAGHLLRRWVDPYLVAGLLHAWNQTYVHPPLPDDELRRILDRVARLEEQRREGAQLPGGEHASA